LKKKLLLIVGLLVAVLFIGIFIGGMVGPRRVKKVYLQPVDIEEYLTARDNSLKEELTSLGVHVTELDNPKKSQLHIQVNERGTFVLLIDSYKIGEVYRDVDDDGVIKSITYWFIWGIGETSGELQIMAHRIG